MWGRNGGTWRLRPCGAPPPSVPILPETPIRLPARAREAAIARERRGRAGRAGEAPYLPTRPADPVDPRGTRLRGRRGEVVGTGGRRRLVQSTRGPLTGSPPGSTDASMGQISRGVVPAVCC